MLIKYFHIERGGLPGGKGVHLATQRIDLARNVAGRPAGRAFEEHMFNEMGISGLRRLFVTRSGINPNADGD
jgi:hypothetical protein